MVSDDFGHVFTPTKIGNLEISNRIVRSATYTCRATLTGFVTDELISVYEGLARGGIGLTITGMSVIREDGWQLPKMLGSYSDTHIDGLTRLAGAYHDVDNEIGNKSKIFLQLGHAGRQVFLTGYQGELISSSPVKDHAFKKISKELTSQEIQEIAECFGEAAKRAKVAGFDGIQFHGAHGYLITQFYSPFMNKRTDEYGGSTENRAKFVVKLLEECRKRVGKSFPITMKMNGSDRVPGGLEVEEAASLARIFANAGFDALEISSYIWDTLLYEKPKSSPPEAQVKLRKRGIEAYNLELALKIKKALNENAETQIPLILVGGLYRFEKIKSILTDTNIEFCSMSRPLIRQPNLPALWRNGPPFPEAECIHCNRCTQDFMVHGIKCKGVRCIKKERDQKKQRD
ncbi:MAG: NADH:flavin oxidoreductase [Candidatus Helarchaeota archaeon]|nr:NADH:flavin oxidoreductase [Candidatus Helarchaeota archaeon]